jgi:hypothetical protein
MQSFWNWLVGEAGAGWIIGLIGIIGAVYAWLKRDRPPSIVIQEVRRLGLLDVHPSQSDRIRVSYLDKVGEECRIESLQQIELVIYNSGTRDVSETVDLVLTFRREIPGGDSAAAQPIGFWRLAFDDETCASGAVATDRSPHEESVRITIPYLNAYGIHHHFIKAYLMTEHSVLLHLVRGSGKGWSARLSTLDDFRTLRRRLARALTLGSLLLFLACSAYFLVEFLRHPVYAVFYNPTLSNIDRLIALLNRTRESVLAHGAPPFWSRLFSPLEFAAGSSYVRAFLAWLAASAVTLHLSLEGQALAARLAARLLGILPPERWRSNN